MDTLRRWYDREQRIDAQSPHFRRDVAVDDDGETIRYSEVTSGRSWILYARFNPAPGAVERVIAREIAHFAPLGKTFEWKTFDYDWPPDLPQRLAAQGFVIGEPETLMILDLQGEPPPLSASHAIDVRRITDPDGIRTGMSILERVWAEDDAPGLTYQELGDSLIAQLETTPDLVSVYIAYVDGVAASCAWISFDQRAEGWGQFAGLYGGSTLAEYRARGLYTALLLARAAEARARGVRYLTIDASPMSRPICARHGFVAVGTTFPCEYQPTSA